MVSCELEWGTQVGLAEQSPHLPLKVLHAELERSDRLSVIGLSNWTLDPAKINRVCIAGHELPTAGQLILIFSFSTFSMPFSEGSRVRRSFECFL